MKIDHIALYVQDLEGAKIFFQTYFAAASNEEYHNRTTGFRSYFLTFDGGARLEIMTRPGLAPPAAGSYPAGYAHLALQTGSREAVDALTLRLKQDGYEIISGPRITGDGYYESCIRGFEGNILEITV